ncbi:MAG TPA: phage holin family protein [Verrucomicrobiota bacterium]|nr:phage holin family protein [Verrucomicrobiota bacterium]
MRAAGRFLLAWGVTALGVFAAAQVVPGIHYRSGAALAAASLLLGLLNAFVRPLLVLLTAPLVLVTLGLFIWIINALLLHFVGNLVRGFEVAGFWPALWGAAVISLISLALNALLGPRRPRAGPRRPPPPRDPGGPVIDV